MAAGGGLKGSIWSSEFAGATLSTASDGYLSALPLAWPLQVDS